MLYSERYKKLQDAIASERAEAILRLGWYQRVKASIEAFEAGAGPAPSLQDLDAWDDTLEKIKQLNEIGVDTQSPPA